MGWTKISDAGAFDSSSGTSLSCTSTLNVAASDSLIVLVGWEGGDTTITVSDGGSNTFTIEPTHVSSVCGVVGYILIASVNGTATFTATWGAARTWRRILVVQARPDSGETVTKDDGPADLIGAGTSIASDNINTSGTDEIIFGFGSAYFTGSTWSAQQIAGSAADASIFISGRADVCCVWYKIFTTDPGDGINATATKSGSGEWYGGILAFKSALSITIEQEGFRFRNDDGNETTATWDGSQDTDITQPQNTTRRIRFILNTSGNANAILPKLEGKPANAANWIGLS